jgi:multiple sugar transport system permease protein
MASPPRYLFKPDFSVYGAMIIHRGYFRYYGNSVFVASAATVLAVFIGAFASFAFVRYNLKSTRLIFFLIILTRAYMPVTTVIPLYLAGRTLGLLDTRLFLLLAYTSFQLPLAVLVMTNFINDIPTEIQESAEIDGCSPIGIFFKIVLPLSGPGLVAAGVLVFIFCWNEFLFALITTSFNAKTATVVLAGLRESEAALHWAELAANGVLMSIPVILFAVFLNKFLIHGLSAGAVKG